MELRQLRAGDDLAAVLALIRQSFAYMEGVIDPPSSMHLLTEEAIAEQAVRGEVWLAVSAGAIGACMFLTPKGDALYLGKLAVDQALRGQGISRRLVDLAERRARAQGFDFVELETRIELRANQDLFTKMGFVQTAARSHPGYDRITSLTFRRAVSALAEPDQG